MPEGGCLRDRAPSRDGPPPSSPRTSLQPAPRPHPGKVPEFCSTPSVPSGAVRGGSGTFRGRRQRPGRAGSWSRAGVAGSRHMASRPGACGVFPLLPRVRPIDPSDSISTEGCRKSDAIRDGARNPLGRTDEAPQPFRHLCGSAARVQDRSEGAGRLGLRRPKAGSGTFPRVRHLSRVPVAALGFSTFPLEGRGVARAARRARPGTRSSRIRRHPGRTRPVLGGRVLESAG